MISDCYARLKHRLHVFSVMFRIFANGSTKLYKEKLFVWQMYGNPEKGKSCCQETISRILSEIYIKIHVKIQSFSVSARVKLVKLYGAILNSIGFGLGILLQYYRLSKVSLFFTECSVFTLSNFVAALSEKICLTLESQSS